VQIPTKATHQQTREYNERLVLRTLYDLGPISRADIARRTHLTRTTVSDVIGELVARGLVQEVGRGPSSGGKAPILLRVIGNARHVIGLDLGESTFTAALVNLRGEVTHSAELPVDGRDGDDALAIVYRLVDQVLAASTGPLLGIGVGAPGVIDTQTGTIRWAVNLDWQDLPLGRLLSERYDLPANIANDSQAAALAEFAFGGGGRRAANLVVITAGRGVGAGIILGGELFQGDGFAAGEVGHVGVVDDGVACRCGRFGCLETVASARAIVGRARELAREAPDSLLGRLPRPLDELTLEDVRVAFELGDPSARTAVLSAGRYLGQAIASIVGTLDVHRVLLHGSVTTFGEPWLAAVRDEATRRTLPILSSELEIGLIDVTSNIVVLGASAMLMTSALGLSLAR
jgi:predicted NBD/HSP70 family sugar kinase